MEITIKDVTEKKHTNHLIKYGRQNKEKLFNDLIPMSVEMIFPIIYDMENWCNLKMKGKIDEIEIKDFMGLEFMYHMFKYYDKEDSFYRRIYDATILMDVRHWKESENGWTTFSNDGSFGEIQDEKRKILRGGIKEYFESMKKRINRTDNKEDYGKYWKIEKRIHWLDLLKKDDYKNTRKAWIAIYKRIIQVLSDPKITLEKFYIREQIIKTLHILINIDSSEEILFYKKAEKIIDEIYKNDQLKCCYVMHMLSDNEKIQINWEEIDLKNEKKQMLELKKQSKNQLSNCFKPLPKETRGRKIIAFFDFTEQ